MRGKKVSLASALAGALTARPGAGDAALAAAYHEACGPRLAQASSCRGLMADGRLLIVASSGAWAEQLGELESEICARVNARLRREVVRGLSIHLGSLEP